MTHDSRLNNHEKATNIINRGETMDANFIAEILVSGNYPWQEAVPTLQILSLNNKVLVLTHQPTQIINP